jgi:hypothetical protein
VLRDVADFVGIALVLAGIVGGLQLLEWGLAADQTEPDAVDSVEIPNPVDLRLQGGGVRARRARALEAERHAAQVRPPAPAEPQP